MAVQILPSLLAADYGALAADITRAFRSGADALHLDIMDAHFVPNLSFGPDIVKLCRRVEPEFYRHVHLMMTRPDLYLEVFAKSGAQTIQIHVEADCDLHAELPRIRALGVRPAIVLNPETPVEAVYPYLTLCDEVLVMTVHPGYGGQSFIAEGRRSPHTRTAPRHHGGWRRERPDGPRRGARRREPTGGRKLSLQASGHGVHRFRPPRRL